MTAYYNEFEPHAAAHLRKLIDAGEIAPGVVDTRSIEDVLPDELLGYTQCHFFAGIGGWSLALRLAGWPDDRPAWTGSCPCQPFSSAGKGTGFEDERHLWPAWQHLIAQCGPPVIFGEQVASKAVEPWIDLVHADLEGMGYAFGCIPFPAASVGAPHIRDRTYWLADTDRRTGGQGRAHFRGRTFGGDAESRSRLGGRSLPSRLAHSDVVRQQAKAGAELRDDERHVEPCGRPVRLGDADGEQQIAQRVVLVGSPTEPNRGFAPGGLGNAHGGRAGWISGAGTESEDGSSLRPVGDSTIASSAADRPGPTNGSWTAADWLLCRDGKWRPVEPGTFPLAHGVSGRVGRLRAYGNAIVPQQAAEFIEAYLAARALGLDMKVAA